MLMMTSTNARITATPGTTSSLSGLHFAERQHGVRESPDKSANGELAGFVLQDALDDSRRELTHCELHDDHRDRQYKCCKTDHRCRDRSQNLQRCVGTAADRLRDKLIVVGLVDGNCAER